MVLTAKLGLGSDMSQTKQQQGAAAANPRARKDWEMFWRIIAGLMLLVIAWIAWVLYQITPRSVVTPLAYASQIRPIGTAEPAIGTVAPTTPPPALTAPAPQPAAEPTAADLAMDQAQAAVRAGAHQASADVQAAALENTEQQIKRAGLRLATELSTPLAEKQRSLKKQEGKPDAAPAKGAAGKDRP